MIWRVVRQKTKPTVLQTHNIRVRKHRENPSNPWKYRVVKLKKFLILLLFLLPLVGKICHDTPSYATEQRWRMILNVPDSKSNTAYLGIILHRLEFSTMIKILFVCHGNQVREYNLQIILDWISHIYLILLSLSNIYDILIHRNLRTYSRFTHSRALYGNLHTLSVVLDGVCLYISCHSYGGGGFSSHWYC